MIRHNVGGLDRVLRVALGVILFLGGLILLTGRAKLGVTLAVVGLLALFTGIIRFCGLYIPFGISTVRPPAKPPSQVCDCAAWMKDMQACRTSSPPSATMEASKDEVVGGPQSR